MPNRLLMLCMVAACASSGCDTLQEIARLEEASSRYYRARAAQFQLEVVVLCSPEGEPRFAPCDGALELVFNNTSTDESGRSRMTDPAMHGELPEGDYEIGLGIEGMQIGLAARIGLVRLHEGRQALGTLLVRFVELPGGTFPEQAVHAERIRRTYDLPVADFVHSPARGFLLVDALLEGPPT